MNGFTRSNHDLVNISGVLVRLILQKIEETPFLERVSALSSEKTYK